VLAATLKARFRSLCSPPHSSQEGNRGALLRQPATKQQRRGATRGLRSEGRPYRLVVDRIAPLFPLARHSTRRGAARLADAPGIESATGGCLAQPPAFPHHAHARVGPSIGTPRNPHPLSPASKVHLVSRRCPPFTENQLGRPRRHDTPPGFGVRLGPAHWILPRRLLRRVTAGAAARRTRRDSHRPR